MRPKKVKNTISFTTNRLFRLVIHFFVILYFGIGYDELVRRLFIAGANINAVNNDGFSALMFAARKGIILKENLQNKFSIILLQMKKCVSACRYTN